MESSVDFMVTPKSSDTAQLIHELRTKLERYAYHYYVLDDPIASDAEYDQLFNQLLQIETENPSLISSDSPTQRVGGTVKEGFAKHTHSHPMLSLENAFEPQDLHDFISRAEKRLDKSVVGFVCEPKLDGIACTMTYERGVFTHAATRGDDGGGLL